MRTPFRTESEIVPGHFNCFGVDLRPGYPLHAHDNHEFFLCVNGAGMQRTDAAVYEMRSGDLFFFGRGTLHACTPSRPKGCKSLVLNVDKEAFASTLQGDRDSGLILGRLIERTGNSSNRIPLSSKCRQDMAALFTDMVREFWQKSPGYECAVKIRIQEMLLLILRDPAMSASFRQVFSPVRSEERLRDVLLFLQQHYAESISVDRIADMACMSRSHFHAVFRKVTGRTLIRYLNELRTEAAARMLRESTDPISRIAFDCGFPCVSHFYSVFTSIAGMPPREFRIGGTRESIVEGPQSVEE